MPHSLPKPIIESTISNRKKTTKTSKEDNDKIMENKINRNSKILTSVNSGIKSEMKSIENNNEESKLKFGGKIKFKSKRENVKTVVGRNLKDFIQAGDDSDLSKKEKPYKDIPSLFSIPTRNRFQILKNST